MRTIKDYEMLPYRMEIIEDEDEGGFVASFPDLRGCITCADTIEAAIANARDAKTAWLEAALEDGSPIPVPNELEGYSGQFKLRIPKSLHRRLAEESKREGISMNQYCLYLLAENNGTANHRTK
ncbi:MAG: type II toxin-antitoxin system HicB family antitoxin [Lachnospiraceae bacterium]